MIFECCNFMFSNSVPLSTLLLKVNMWPKRRKNTLDCSDNPEDNISRQIHFPFDFWGPDLSTRHLLLTSNC